MNVRVARCENDIPSPGGPGEGVTQAERGNCVGCNRRTSRAASAADD